MRNAVLIAGAVILTGSAALVTMAPEDQLARAVTEVERLDAMRSRLADSLGVAPAANRATFDALCGRVGQEAGKIGEANGWVVGQQAVRYRNPVNMADKEATRFVHLLAADPSIQGLWIHTEMNGKPGMRYIRRIEVKESCMPCHGSWATRPEFIKAGYPRDRAYDFEVGEIRGVYSVFIPEAK